MSSNVQLIPFPSVSALVIAHDDVAPAGPIGSHIEQLPLGPVVFVPRIRALVVDGLGVVGEGVAGHGAGRCVVVAEPDGGVVLAGRDIAAARACAGAALRRVAGAVLPVP
ncbi:hypothetical protein PG989_007789 [Apiospora arundinis]